MNTTAANAIVTGITTITAANVAVMTAKIIRRWRKCSD